jgi:cytochrome c2
MTIRVSFAAPELHTAIIMAAVRLTLCAVLLVTAAANAQEPAKYFEDNCAPCHAIGGPPGAAPDLKDVSKRHDRQWLVRFILDPEGMSHADVAAAALVKQYDGAIMPAVGGVSATFVDELLRYIDGRAAVPEAPAVPQRTATAADVIAGREWYEGKRPLSRGGPPCVSCHHIESIGRLGGGTLGPDLTQAHRRLGGGTAVAKWLGNPPTRVMRAVFHVQPLSDEEAFTIAALLADESSRQTNAARAPGAVFLAGGVGTALVALASMGTVWRRRLKSVRRPLLAASRSGRP